MFKKLKYKIITVESFKTNYEKIIMYKNVNKVLYIYQIKNIVEIKLNG